MTYYPIPLDRLRFGVATDASFDNYKDGSSQGAVGVLAYDVDLCSGASARCSLLWWKSGKLRRKVPSTLAAETQALNRGLGELMWTKAIFGDVAEEKFDLQGQRQAPAGTGFAKGRQRHQVQGVFGHSGC